MSVVVLLLCGAAFLACIPLAGQFAAVLSDAVDRMRR